VTTAIQELARFAATLQVEAVPPSLVDKAKDHLLDTIGVACAGVGHPDVRSIADVVKRWGGAPEACVIGSRTRLPAPSAAFLNALHARIHTFDDTHEAGPSHPGNAVVAAALAAAECAEVSGRTLLTALIAGYEVATRVSAALGASHYAAGFHNTGTATPLGAATAAARARGFDAARSAAALGLAGEAAIGLRQYQDDGSMLDTALNGARGARLGVEAAAWAAAGAKGPHGVLDGRFGMLRVMHGADASRLTDGLGDRWEFSATQLKPYASCRYTHGPVQALREAGIDAAQVHSVEIATFRTSVEVSDRPDPAPGMDAVLSHQLAAALALLDRPILPRALEMRDEAVAALARRVRVVHDARLDAAYPASWPHRITVRLKDGRRIELASDHAPSADRAQVRDKFRALAMDVFDPQQTEQIIAAIDALDRLPDVRALLAPLTRAVMEAA